MHISKKSLFSLGLMSLVVLTAAAQTFAATQYTFIPPNNTNGSIFSNFDNNGYSGGRGAVFTLTQNFDLSSIGFYTDLQSSAVSYKVSQVTSLNGDLTLGETVLTSGQSAVSTTGLQFVDFSFSQLRLTAGNDYWIDFTYSDPANQNFFYANDNVPFTTGPFDNIDGTQGPDASNSVMPAIRVNGPSPTTVPEPSSVAAFVFGLLGVGVLVLCKRKIHAQ